MSNLQQLDDRVTALEAALGKSAEQEANFIRSTVAPFDARLSAIETRLSQIEKDIAEIKGTKPTA